MKDYYDIVESNIYGTLKQSKVKSLPMESQVHCPPQVVHLLLCYHWQQHPLDLVQEHRQAGNWS
jgi:hypothetical protein